MSLFWGFGVISILPQWYFSDNHAWCICTIIKVLNLFIEGNAGGFHKNVYFWMWSLRFTGRHNSNSNMKKSSIFMLSNFEKYYILMRGSCHIWSLEIGTVSGLQFVSRKCKQVILIWPCTNLVIIVVFPGSSYL